MRNNRRVVVFGLGAAAALVLALASVAFAATWTDKPDYSPGSVVTISGDDSNGVGYVPGNSVDVVAAGPNDWSASCTATVSDDRSWSCQLQLSSDPAVAVGDYTYTATSLDAAGNPIREDGSFSDSGTGGHDITFSIDTPTINAGDSITVRGRVTHNGAGEPLGYIQIDTSGYSIKVVYPDADGYYVGTLASGTYVPVVGGTYTYHAHWAGSDGGQFMADASAILTVIGKAASTTTVTCPASAAYTGSALTPCTAVATGSGGLNESLTVSYTNNVNAGTATASATFAGDDAHLGSSGSETFTIAKAPTTTTVAFEAGPYEYRGADFTATAFVSGAGMTTASVPVTYGGDCLSVTSANGCTASAWFAGDANHNGSNGSSSITIVPAETFTTVTCTGNSFVFTGTPIAPCTASVRGPLMEADLTVSYLPDNINAGTVTAAARFDGATNYGPSENTTSFEIVPAASVTHVSCEGGPYQYIAAPITPCTATATVLGVETTVQVQYTNNVDAGTAFANASFPGDANIVGSADTATFAILPAATTTTMTCAGGPFVFTGSPIEACTARVVGPGLDQAVGVSYSPDNVNAGPVTATANFSGGGNYQSSGDGATFAIEPVSTQTVLTCSGASFTFTGLPIEPCSATIAIDGVVTPLSVTYSEEHTSVGLVTASAFFVGDENHASSGASTSFRIVRAPSTTTVTCSGGPFTYANHEFDVCTASVEGPALNSDLEVIYDPDNVNAGTVTASASFSGGGNWSPSSGSAQFTIDKATSSVYIDCKGNPYVYTGSPITRCQGQVVGVNLSHPVTVTYEDNVNAGTATASATFPGDENHLGSSNTVHFGITRAPSVTRVTFEAGPYVYRGTAFTATATTTGAGGLTASPTVTYTGDCTNVTTEDGCTASASYAGDANHVRSDGSATITITKAPSITTVSFEAGPYVYRGTAFTATAGTTGAGGLTASPTVTYSGDCTNVTTADGCTASASYMGDGNHDGSSDTKSITITKATLMVTAADQEKAYASPNPSLTFAYTGFVASEGVGVIDTAPTCSTTATQYSPVGEYPITCSGGVDGNYSFEYVNATLTIERAEALVSYVGETIFVTSGTTSTTVQATLTATLQAVDEAYLLGAATVDFRDVTSGKVLAAGVPVSPVEGQPNVGTANVRVTLSTGQYGAESYLIEVAATGNYTNADQAEVEKTAALVVIQPSAANTTRGGGTIDPLAPAGTYAGDPGELATFSIGLAYNNKGTNLQGQITLQVPQADGSILWVKSNALSSMKIVTASDGKTSTIYAKASIYRIVDGTVKPIDGNVTLRVDVYEPGANDPTHARVGFTVLSTKTSNLYYSNDWVLQGTGRTAAWKTLVQALASGSVDIN